MKVKFSFILKNGRDVEVIVDDEKEKLEKVVDVISTAFTNNLEAVARLNTTLVRISDCSVAEWEILDE